MKHLWRLVGLMVMATAGVNTVAQQPSAVPENSGFPEQSSQGASSIDVWIQQIQSIGREGAGAGAASQAVQHLSSESSASIPALLDAFKDANPIARNLLRGVVESIADEADGRLPIPALVRFVQNPQRHDPHARGLAFDLLRRAAPEQAEPLVPELLHDPNPDLRRLAVAGKISRAKRLAEQENQSGARAAYETALSGAIDKDQVSEIVEALQEFGVAIDLQRHFGFITEWQIIGPFDNTDHVGFDAVYPPETEYQPAANYRGKLGDVTWQAISTEDEYGIVDIAKSLENYKGSAMYLVAEFHSDRPREAQIRLGTQNAWKLWLNGEFLFGHEEYHRGMIMDQHRIPIHLNEGENRILLKMLQDEQPDDWAQSYNFQLRITDEAGAAIHSTKAIIPVVAPRPSIKGEISGDAPSRRVAGVRLSSRACGDTRTGRRQSAPSTLPTSQWNRFRGPGAVGRTPHANPPVEWDDVDPPGWAAELPGKGFSQPVVINNLVFTTCGSGFSKNHLHVLCHDLKTGKQLWHRQYWATGRTTVPPDMRVATPTPVVTDDRLYCLFSSGDLACLDHQGRLIWFRGLGSDYPNTTNNLGMASSPLLVDGDLICQMETDSAAFAIGLDASTGQNLWKIERLHKANWTSPIPYDQEKEASVLLEGADGVQAVDPATGETLWRHACGGSTVSSMTLAGDHLLVPADGLTALQLSGNGDPIELWNNQKLSCSFVSPVVADDRVYIINDAGVLRCAEIETGKMLWQARLHGSFWGTPSAAGGRLYCSSREGALVIVDLVETPGEILAEHEIGEGLFSPPVLVADSVLLRTDTRLIRIVRP